MNVLELRRSLLQFPSEMPVRVMTSVEDRHGCIDGMLEVAFMFEAARRPRKLIVVAEVRDTRTSPSRRVDELVESLSERDPALPVEVSFSVGMHHRCFFRASFFSFILRLAEQGENGSSCVLLNCIGGTDGT